VAKTKRPKTQEGTRYKGGRELGGKKRWRDHRQTAGLAERILGRGGNGGGVTHQKRKVQGERGGGKTSVSKKQGENFSKLAKKRLRREHVHKYLRKEKDDDGL